MAYTFTPVYTYAFTGADVNPLPSPWLEANTSFDVNELQQKSNKGAGTSSPGAIPSVSAMLYSNPKFLPPYKLISSPCYAEVEISSLVNDVDTESGIDLILRSDVLTLTHGFSTEISRNSGGGYHFDCVSLADDQLVFSEDFGTTAPASGDLVTVTSVGTTQAVFLNGTLKVSGTSTANPGAFESTVYLQINNGVALTDPTISQFVVGSVAGSL